MWLYFYGPLSSITHNGMLSASARLNIQQCFITCICLCVSVWSHPTNNASLRVSPRAPLTFLPVSLPSEGHIIRSSHIYWADLCLLRTTLTHWVIMFVSDIILPSYLVIKNDLVFICKYERTWTYTEKHSVATIIFTKYFFLCSLIGPGCNICWHHSLGYILLFLSPSH